MLLLVLPALAAPEDAVVSFGLGTGFFVDPTHVVTAAHVAREFGPATAIPAQSSVTESTCTFNSGQSTSKRYSSRLMTGPAWMVVVVIM